MHFKEARSYTGKVCPTLPPKFSCSVFRIVLVQHTLVQVILDYLLLESILLLLDAIHPFFGIYHLHSLSNQVMVSIVNYAPRLLFHLETRRYD